LEAWLTVWR